ncbi:MAG: small-conductance mechanosensitive channel [Paracoccaceae bacterium]|jgi:small-conductance mechanosensitive channel
MEAEFAVLLQQASVIWDQIEVAARGLLRPRQLYQVGALFVIFALSYGVVRLFGARIYDRMRGLGGTPKWQLRVLLVLHSRLQLILFVVFARVSIAIAEQLSPWPSTRYLLVLAVTISTAWLIVALASRLVSNNLLRVCVSWGAWIYVTLYYTALLEPTMLLLDHLAIDLGSFRLSLLTVLKAVVIIGLMVTLARLITTSTTVRIRRNPDISPSMQVLAVKLLQIVMYGTAFFIGMKMVGFDLTGLAFLSGAVGLGLGFGLQKVVSNLVSGLIILLDKSIKPGDVISLGETFGWINALGARYVSVVTRDGKEYLIPNEDLITGQVVNWSHSNEFVRLDIYFGAAYHNDPHVVRALAVAAAKQVPRVLGDRAPVCHIVGFGDSSVDYILRFWISDPTAGLTNIRGAVFLALWDAFKSSGIDIPFPQREVRMVGGPDMSPVGNAV